MDFKVNKRTNEKGQASDVDIEFPDGQVYNFHFTPTENKEVEKQRISKAIFKTCLV